MPSTRAMSKPPPFVGLASPGAQLAALPSTFAANGSPHTPKAKARTPLKEESSRRLFASMQFPPGDEVNRRFTDEGHPLSARTYNRLLQERDHARRPATTDAYTPPHMKSPASLGPSFPRVGVNGGSRVRTWENVPSSSGIGKLVENRRLRQIRSTKVKEDVGRQHRIWLKKGDARNTEREKKHNEAMKNLSDAEALMKKRNAERAEKAALARRKGELPRVESSFSPTKLRGVRPNQPVPGNYHYVMSRATQAMLALNLLEQELNERPPSRCM